MPDLARRSIFVLAVAALTVLVGCSGSSTPSGYGDDGLRRSFLTGCQTEAERDGIDDPRAYCRCSYGQLSQTIDFDEFKSVHERLSRTPGPLPASWQTALAECEL